jgi:hypothetical protein
MQELTHEAVNAAMKKRIDPETISIVESGDFAKAAKAAPAAEPKK